MSKFPLHFKYLGVCILITLAITCLIGVLPISLETCHCENYMHNLVDDDFYSAYDTISNDNLKKPKLAVLVPFRDRFEELLEFAPHLDKFLTKQNLPHHIFILNQVDRFRFNRASLINVGFLYTKNDFDYVAMHDVDLLPLNDNLKYEFPRDGPIHISGPEFHPKYHYPNFVGGILLVSRDHYDLLNGMSNKYWGWGLEDDEFYVRMKEAKLVVTRPKNITTGPGNTFLDIHSRTKRKRDTQKCFNQREMTRKRDRETGLHNVKYRIRDKKDIMIEKTHVTVINIELECDFILTPWCDCESQSSAQSAAQQSAINNKKQNKKN